MPKKNPTKEDYKVFKIPKRRKGQFRTIEAPNDKLKEEQRESLPELKSRLYESPFAHAFTGNKNIVTMAKGHVKKEFVLSFDLADFFPSITKKALLDEINTNMSFRRRLKHDRKQPDKKMETTKEVVKRHVEKHFCDFDDGHGERLPQGAPGSPFLSNTFLHGFDWFAARKCKEKDITYSRYADDVTLSGANENDLWRVFYFCLQPYLNKRGLKVNRRKTKMMSSKHRQMVCGLVVNEKINIPRRWRKNLRAELHQQGTSLKDLEEHPEKAKKLKKSTRGRLAFLYMVYGKDYKHITDSMEYLDIQKVLVAARK